MDESEAWKGLRTAVTSLAPAGRGVWGPGTQNLKALMLFGQVSSYTVPHQETENLGFMEFTWQMGSLSLSLFVSLNEQQIQIHV